ncbi:traB domain-containing protein-like [Anthonomus grandis grandis]|uniref:traB domain-containing protein-like n=1 Tax=Anthonomus grandis grandis TaxID=2921223 RepID=UPI0021653B0D|nr:traB domain-containing protein-like [Anthonomus grandis grandis]
MDNSLTNFELSESTVKIGTDSESGSDKSEAIEIVGYGDEELNSSKKSSEEDFDNNLPDTVTILTHKETGAKLYLIGTAHFSKKSQEDVELVIRNAQPNIVVVELCGQRTSILELDEETILKEAKNIDAAKIIATMKADGAVNGLLYILLLSMSAHITKEIGMAPGGEFRVASQEAAKIPNCYVHLGDRPIGITIRRALSRLSWWQTVKFAWHLLTCKDPISAEEIEKCKNRDMLEQLLAELAGEFPGFKEVFLVERDIYLTSSLQAAARMRPPGDPEKPLTIVGVVGIGHMPGIIKLWPEEQRRFIPGIMVVPPPTMTSKIVKFSFKLSLFGLGVYVIYRYVPVPKVLRENAMLQSVVSNVKDNLSSLL